MKKEKNELLRLLAGLAMLVVGIYWFTSSVTVSTGFYSLRIGSFRSGGLVVVPLIIGVIWLCVNNDSILPKILTVIGLLLIIASVIMGTQFYFRRSSLYEYLIMLVLIFGGGGLILSVLFARPKDR